MGHLSSSRMIGYILLGGLIMFISVFLGIQAGFALKGNAYNLTPDVLRNRTTMIVGDVIPALPVMKQSGEWTRLSEALADQKTVMAVVMPGCGPCSKLMKRWAIEEMAQKAAAGYHVAILAAVDIDSVNLGELDEYVDGYEVLYCSAYDLDDFCGVASFPSLIGIGQGGVIRFIANDMVFQLDHDFFSKYL